MKLDGEGNRLVKNPSESKLFVFVLMPFSDEFDDVYLSGIKPACEAVNVDCQRVDDQKFDEPILERIWNQIRAADIIVADMTGCNPNVFYEVGFAHAVHKRVILLTKDSNDIPFDLKHRRHIVYAGKSYKLKRELIEELKWCKAEPQDIDPWLSRPIVGRITRILAQVSKIVANQSEIRALLDNIVHEMTEILEAEVCSIFLNEPDRPDVITCVAGSGFAHEIIGLAEYSSGEGFTGKVFQRGQTTIIRSSEELEQLRQRNEFQGKYDGLQWAVFGGQSQFRNCIAAPLKIGDQTVGVIKVENKRIGNFTVADVGILEAITNGVLSVAIQNARLLESSRAHKSERWGMPSRPKEFFERNPNPIEPGYVFALLPEKSKDIYLKYVKKAAESLSPPLRCESFLDLTQPGEALDDILARIQKAEVLVYDITDLTPSVMWELGVGLTIKDASHVLVICESNTPLPFNVSHHQVHRYDPTSEESLIELHKTLKEAMKRILESSISAKGPHMSSPEVKALLQTALQAVANKEWIAAEALFQTMDIRDPDNWSIYNQWGIMYRSKGEFEAALAKFNQALEYTDIDDVKAFIYTELAVLHQVNRKYAEAEDWFRKAEKADRENNRLYIAWAEYYDELGDHFNAQAKIAGAFARMGKGRESDPTYQELMLRHNYYGKKIKTPNYRKTFDQFRREESLPPARAPISWDESGRLPYNISWDDLVEKYVGTVVDGEISDITAEHGIFVRLSREFTGLIFWKNLTEGFWERFSRNQRIKVRISKAFMSPRDQRARIDLRLVE